MDKPPRSSERGTMKPEQYKYIPVFQCLPLIIQRQLDYIYETRSLTNKLRQKYSDISLKCYHYQFEKNHIRDVMILAQQQPKWCARTTIPENTLQHLKILFPIHQKHAIGDFLFTHSSMKRLSLTIDVFPNMPNLMLNHFGLQANRNLYWLRKSKWCFAQDYYFEILEIF